MEMISFNRTGRGGETNRRVGKRKRVEQLEELKNKLMKGTRMKAHKLTSDGVSTS